MNDQNQQLLPEKDPLLESVPELEEFVDQVEKVISPDHPDSFWLCQPQFETLIRSDFLTRVLNHHLSKLVDESEYTLREVDDTEFTILRRDSFQLGASIRRGIRNRSLFGLPEHTMLGTIGPDLLEVEWFHQPAPQPNEILDRTKRLEEKGRCIINPGEVVRFRALEDIFHLLPPQTVSIAVVLTSKSIARFFWKYDPETLLPTKVVAASVEASRLEYASWALTELGEGKAIPNLISLYEHQDHFIRWAAIRAVIQLDYEEGVKLLSKALEDPHPHVRNAAQSSAELLGLSSLARSGAGRPAMLSRIK